MPDYSLQLRLSSMLVGQKQHFFWIASEMSNYSSADGFIT